MRLSTDGYRYLWMAEGKSQAIPYHFRWLLPRLLGSEVTRWAWLTEISVLATTLLLAVYCILQGVEPVRAVLIALMFLHLPQVQGFWRQYPVLTDMPGMALSLLTAIIPGPWCIPIALLSGCVREASPVFAAMYAWSPWPLVGLAAPALRLLWKPGTETDPRVAALLAHPWKTSWERNKAFYLNWRTMLIPWGGFLGALANPSWKLAVAYAICLIPTLRQHAILRMVFQALPVFAVALGGAPVAVLCAFAFLHFTLPIGAFSVER